MRRFERPEDIRARLRDLDRLAKAAGADPTRELTGTDVARMFDLMRRARDSQQPRAR